MLAPQQKVLEDYNCIHTHTEHKRYHIIYTLLPKVLTLLKEKDSPSLNWPHPYPLPWRQVLLTVHVKTHLPLLLVEATQMGDLFIR